MDGSYDARRLKLQGGGLVVVKSGKTINVVTCYTIVLHSESAFETEKKTFSRALQFSIDNNFQNVVFFTDCKNFAKTVTVRAFYQPIFWNKYR